MLVPLAASLLLQSVSFMAPAAPSSAYSARAVAPQVSSPSPSSLPAGRRVTLNIYRHGYSCQNTVFETLPGWMQGLVEVDTPLTNYGVNSAQARAGEILPSDVWLCSTMLRAVETALYLSYGTHAARDRPVVSVPFAAEVNGHTGRTVSSGESYPPLHKWWLDNYVWSGASGAVDYRFVATEDQQRFLEEQDGSLDRFLRWLGENLDALLDLSGVPRDKSHVVVSLVSHGNWIRRALKQKTGPGQKPLDNLELAATELRQGAAAGPSALHGASEWARSRAKGVPGSPADVGEYRSGGGGDRCHAAREAALGR